MNDNSNISIEDENADINIVLDCLELPTNGLGIDPLIVEFRKLLGRYTANQPLKVQVHKPPTKVITPPKPVLKPPSPAPTPTPVAVPQSVPVTPSPEPSPDPAPVPVALSVEEQSELDEIDRQIQAKQDMLSSTSPIVLYYK